MTGVVYENIDFQSVAVHLIENLLRRIFLLEIFRNDTNVDTVITAKFRRRFFEF